MSIPIYLEVGAGEVCLETAKKCVALANNETVSVCNQSSSGGA